MSSRRGSERRAGERHGDLRRELMRCATELLLEKDDWSLREVARRAGVAPGAPYNHFPDKGALLLALAEDGFEGLALALVEATCHETEPRARLHAMLVAYLRFALAHGPHYRLMFPRDESARGPRWQALAIQAFQRLALAVAAVRGDLGPDEAAARATAVWALCHGLVTLRLDGLLSGPALRTNQASFERTAVSAADAIITRP